MQRKCGTISILCSMALIQGHAIFAQEGAAAAGAVPPEANRAIQSNAGSDSREQLNRLGISLGFSYIGETFTNLKGGLDSRRSAYYLGGLVSTASVDLSRMKLGRGQFFLSAQSIHGRGVNEGRVGAIQSASNLDSMAFTKFVEAWYADSYLDGKLKVKAGRQYADSDFGLVENGGAFLNSSYGLMPTTPMPSYPEPRLGVNVWVAPVKWISWGAGVYQGGSLDAFSDEGSPVKKKPFTVFETKLEPFAGNSTQQGTYRFGVWRQARGAWLPETADVTGEPATNYGMYFAGDHWFARTESDEHRGPGVFAQWGWTPADRNEVTGYTGGGFVYQGLVPGRPGDVAGLGLTRVKLGTGQTESVWELFYKFRITEKVMLQPDLQWFRTPGGSGPRALVAGVRMGVDF